MNDVNVIKYLAGGNDDQYSGKGRIWEIAKRYNNQSKALNGSVTCTRRRQVSKSKYEPVGVL